MGQHLLLVGGQESHLVDLPEIGLQGALNRVTSVSANTGHEDPRCVGQNWVRSSQRSWGELAAKSARLRADIEPGAPVRPRRSSGYRPAARAPSLLFTPTVDADVPGKVSVIPPTCPLGCTLVGSGRQSRVSDRPEGCLDSGKRRELPPPRRLPRLFIPLCRSRFHTTRYRTTHFDNLRRTWKSRMYWEYTKTSDLVNPKFRARARLVVSG